MRLLVVGAGSIGRRHARNATVLTDVGLYDVEQARCRQAAQDSGARSFNTFAEALAWSPTAAVVATPPATHISLATELVDAGVHVLIEKPIAHELDGIAAFLERAEKHGRIVVTACNMRFHPGPATIRANLDVIGGALFARAYFGHYLPSMRPDSDYRSLYCSRKKEGGGVCLDGIHEVDYLTWLFGPITTCRTSIAKLSELDIDVEDYASISLKHASGVYSEVHLDYLQHFKRRGCEVVGTEGTIIWESEGKAPERCTVRVYQKRTASWETLFTSDSLDVNAPYRELLENFVAHISGKRQGCLLNGRIAAQELALVLQARSADDAEPWKGAIRSS